MEKDASFPWRRRRYGVFRAFRGYSVSSSIVATLSDECLVLLFAEERVDGGFV